MNQEEHSMLEELITSQREMRGEVHTISRGLYGDAPNGVTGLIDRTRDVEEALNNHEKRIVSGEGFKKRLIWIGSMVPVAAGALWELIKAFVHGTGK